MRMTASGNIVVIDGDAAIRAALTFSLELEGFAVVSHASGEDYLAQERLPRAGCLVLDHRLPGMTGLDLLAALRERDASLPAVIITSNPSRRLRARIAAAGAVIVEKPLLCDALAAAVRRELGAARLAA